MAHSARRGNPTDAMKSCICRFFCQARHVEARDLDFRKLTKDDRFNKLVKNTAFIRRRHKDFNVLLDKCLHELIEQEVLVLDGTCWVLNQQEAHQMLRKRPKRPGSPPRTVKRRPRAVRQRPIPVG